MTIIAKESHAIHCHIMDNNITNKLCILITLYDPTQNRDKHAFWYHLKQLNESITLLPWSIIGHFSELHQSSDKVRGACLTIARSKRLNEFLVHTKSIYAHV